MTFLRRHGYLAAVTERWNAYAKKRLDLFGFGDVLAVRRDERIWAIQACVTGDRTKRIEKLTTAPVAAKVAVWLAAGGRVSVLSWTRYVRAGRIRARYHLSETTLTLGDRADELLVGELRRVELTRPRRRRQSSPRAARPSG